MQISLTNIIYVPKTVESFKQTTISNIYKMIITTHPPRLWKIFGVPFVRDKSSKIISLWTIKFYYK